MAGDEAKHYHMRCDLLVTIIFIAIVAACICVLYQVYERSVPWYRKYHVIAHSGGGIKGYAYTNSLEGWKKAYQDGDRVFDADMRLTSDHKIVLRHEWSDDLGQGEVFRERVPEYEEFMDTLIYEELTPMSLGDVITFMDEHQDVYVAVDFKDGTDLLRKMVEEYLSLHKEELLKRIIISFYQYGDLEEIKAIYAFENYAIRQYENCPHDYAELTSFCVENEIPVCMIKIGYMREDNISELLDNGICVWTAIVNTEDELAEVKNGGASGIVSDFLYEDMIGWK